MSESVNVILNVTKTSKSQILIRSLVLNTEIWKVTFLYILAEMTLLEDALTKFQETSGP